MKLTDEEILRMARETGLGGLTVGKFDLVGVVQKHLLSFAHRIQQHENEQCAKVCESYENDMGYGQPQQCANAIRARMK